MADRPQRRAVLVPTMNRLDDMMEMVDSVLAQTVPVHVLAVVDAGDTPTLARCLREKLDPAGIELIYRTSIPGTSLQRNIGLDLLAEQLEDNDLVFFFDDDVLLESNYVAETQRCMDLPLSPPVGCVLATFTQEPRARGWQQHWFRAFQMTHQVDGNEANLGAAGAVQWLREPTIDAQVPVASGGRTCYRWAAIKSERLDEFLPGYTLNEDVEYSFRIAKKWSIVHSPTVKLFHKRSPKQRIDYGDRVSRMIYSQFYFFRKHRPRDPGHLAALAWNAAGTSTFYVAAGLLKADSKDRLGAIRGVVHGYKKCLVELKNPRPE
jgi:GT2 family glycosyltransferase